MFFPYPYKKLDDSILVDAANKLPKPLLAILKKYNVEPVSVLDPYSTAFHYLKAFGYCKNLTEKELAVFKKFALKEVSKFEGSVDQLLKWLEKREKKNDYTLNTLKLMVQKPKNEQGETRESRLFEYLEEDFKNYDKLKNEPLD